MEVSASGVPRPRRNELAALVQRLRGTWSGALTVGRTAAVVVDGPAADIDWTAPKLATAAQHGIPVVPADWVLDSLAHGFLLSTAAYRLEPPPPSRRSSAASTSAAAGPPPPVQTAGTADRSRAAARVQTAQPQRAPASGSPPAVELEVLRGEALHPRGSPLLPQRSPQAAAASPAPASKPRLAADVLQEPPPSPGAEAPQRADSFSRLLRGSPLQLPEEAEGQEKQGQESSRHQDAAAWPTPGSPCMRSGALLAAAGPDATPGPPSAATDSDTKVARFLSRMPMVTLARGSCLPRRCLPPDSSSSSSNSSSSWSSDGTSIHSSLSGSGSGSAERMDGCCGGSSPGGVVLRGMLLDDHTQPWGQEAEGEGEPAAVAPSPASRASLDQPASAEPGSASAGAAAEDSAVQSPLRAAACAADTGLRPPAPAELRRQQVHSLLRMRASLAEARLPATTLIRLGAQLQRPPLKSTIDGVLERHCGSDGSEAASSCLSALSFHASAEALPEVGPMMEFVAGDTRHGAVMLYDIREGGRRVYALALVQAIYRIHDGVGRNGMHFSPFLAFAAGCWQVWMEHRYLVNRQDLQERPGWAAAVQGLEMRPDEVLLSVNSYHSPMHLVTGEFSLSFPGRAQRTRRGQQPRQRVSGSAAAGSAASARQYSCRRGFDAAAGRVVPLRRALEGFAPAGA